MTPLVRAVRREGFVPLSWAGGTSEQNYVNLGDALSPVMTTLLSGLPVRRVPFRSRAPRLCAVGTVAQNLFGGEAWVWGSGCDPRLVRLAPRPGLGPRAVLHVAATRGPLSASRLGGGSLATTTFGDPVWLLPRFHRPATPKTHALGAILHLTELADRGVACRPDPGIRRYRVPPALAGTVRLINTVCEPTPHGMRAKLAEILSCERLVSTSLHGLVFAESYGVPCLPFPSAGATGLARVALRPDAPLDARILDLYMGAGRRETPVYGQARDRDTDWEAVIAAIDAAWEPATIDEAALMEAFPLDLAPVAPPADGDVWDLPALWRTEYAHDVAALRRADADASAGAERARQAAEGEMASAVAAWRLPATVAPPRTRPLRLERRPQGAGVALSWARARTEPSAAEGGRLPGWPAALGGRRRVGRRVNLGDALSPILVAALTGLPVRHAAFDSPVERLVAVGTIAHGQTAGVAHLWGPGLDATVNVLERGAPWRRPPDVEFVVHAMRGPISAASLRLHGVAAPDCYGDPVHLLDRVFPLGTVEKRYDLGVVLHLTEIDDAGAPLAQHRRYAVPDALRDRVRLIDTLAEPTEAGFRAKLTEIAQCRAILSTSLHGLVVAEVYGVPCAWFALEDCGLRAVDPFDAQARIDHRVRDLYAGRGVEKLPIVGSPRERPADWERLLGLAGELEPRRVDARGLFDAFPGPRAVGWDEARWPLPEAAFAVLA